MTRDVRTPRPSGIGRGLAALLAGSAPRPPATPRRCAVPRSSPGEASRLQAALALSSQAMREWDEGLRASRTAPQEPDRG